MKNFTRIMKLINLVTVTFFAFILKVKASERGEGEVEPFTGIFDKIQGDITDDIINNVVPTRKAVLVYGMIVRPSVNVIKKVLSRGLVDVDVNAFDGYGRCSLTYALDNEDYEAADALIEAGANVNAFSFSTIFVIMVQNDNFDEEKATRAVNYLLSHGADPRARGASGFCALGAAAGRGYPNLVQFFLDLGLDVNYQDEYERSALIRSVYAYYPNLEVVQILLANVADMTLKDRAGETAVFIALYRYSCGYNYDTGAVVEYLLNNGGLALLNEVNNKGKTVRQAVAESDHWSIPRNINRFNALMEKFNIQNSQMENK